MSTKLEQLLQKESQLKAQIQKAKALERTKEKKKDTRRKILIGSAIMAQIEAGEFSEKNLITMMDTFLSRPNERDLFGLSTPEPTQSNQKAQKATSTPPKKSAAKKKRFMTKVKPKSQ
ncbi:MAG: hypothetical protein AAF050_18195 [Cyanobacteria bacterium J06649_5]